MNFKVGDRVRFVREAAPAGKPLIGKEGVIVGIGPHCAPGATYFAWDCHVDFGPSVCQVAVNCLFPELEPLTPPAADTWAADAVRKVTKPQHVEPSVPHPVRITNGDAAKAGLETGGRGTNHNALALRGIQPSPPHARDTSE